MEIAFLIGRFLFGGFFIINGINHFKNKNSLAEYAKSKHVPSPELAVSLTGAILFVSGICLAFGWFVAISLWSIIGFLLIISFTMHNFWKEENPSAKAIDKVNFMKNIALVGACLLLLSIDSWPPLL